MWLMCLDKVSCIFRIFIMITSLPQVERARADCSLQAGTGSAACRPILPPSCKDTPALVYLLFYNQLLFLHSIFPAHKCKTLPLILMTPIVPKKGNAKECSNYRTIALISYNVERFKLESPSWLNPFPVHHFQVCLSSSTSFTTHQPHW